ncbi:MAG: hypothetical protein SFZ02_19345 [bacterium]|nr:hypothetical protein [bacterium]
MSKNLELGGFGEWLAQREFERLGYLVTIPTQKMQGDLKVIDPETGDVKLVEIKTAKRSQCGWQFCLNKREGNHYKTKCTYANITILQLVGDSGLVVAYAIPSALLEGVKGTSFRRITPTKRNRWAGYVSDYRIFGGVM